MNQNPRNRRNENEDQNDGWSDGAVAAAGLATVATVAGGALYWLFSGSKKSEAPQSKQPEGKPQSTQLRMPQTAQPQRKPIAPSPAPSEAGSSLSGLINQLTQFSDLPSASR